jgi:hypothetical protein
MDPSMGRAMSSQDIYSLNASVQTMERYLGTKQDLANAPNDGIKLKLAA